MLRDFGEAGIRPLGTTVEAVLEAIGDPDADAAVDAFRAAYGLELEWPDEPVE